MMIRRRLAILVIALILWGVFASGSITAQGNSETINVALKEIEPFVIQEGETFNGFSIDVWEEVAARADIDFEYTLVPRDERLITLIQYNGADIGVSATSITSEREAIVDFSHPFFPAGLQIMTRLESEGVLKHLLDAFLSQEFLRVMGIFVIVIIIAAHIVWLIERKANPDFPSGYLEGIFEGIWWSMVTATTVGYGDTVPRRRFGRIMALIWMVAGIFLIAYVTAVFTSTITLNELRGNIDGPDDLPGKRVATLVNATASGYLSRNNIEHITVERIEDAYEMLERSEIDAVVFDVPALLQYASTDGRGKVAVVGQPFQLEDYGFVLPNDSDLREVVNVALLDIQRDGTYEQIYEHWFSFGNH